jgi:hypothetical protein
MVNEAEEEQVAQIKVIRKTNTRKNGIVVKGTTFYTTDKSKPEKTPQNEK